MEEKLYDENAIVDTGKKVVNKGGEMYVNGLNKRANFVAKQMTKKDKPNEDSSEEAYEKYKAEYTRWKQTYKAAEILTIKAIGFGPFDWVFTTFAACGILHSEDPDDKKLQELFKKSKGILDKVKGIITKAGDAGVKRNVVDRDINVLNINCLRLSKGIDHFKVAKREDVPKIKSAHFSQSVKESAETDVFDKDFVKESVERILYAGKEQIDEIAFETVSRMINKLDLFNEKDAYIIECCIDVINRE